ncbi:MAG: ABC transporter permease [Alphaproteobacteria bacterium]|nr:ABC transporter permease [Pseudomonadota bacterium]
MSSIYKIQPEDRKYVAEYRRNPVGHHSPGLRRILTLFRGAPMPGKHVLVCVKPHEEWVLGQVADEPGKPVKILKNKVFHDLKDAEWAVFKIRWKQHTGEDIA